MSIEGINNDYKLPEHMLKHIFWGEITKKNEVQGYHHEDNSYGDSKMKVHKQLYCRSKNRLITENKNKGIYEAIVVEKNNGLVKLGNNGISTFYPRNWERQRVVDCVKSAELSKKLIKHYSLRSGKTKEKRMNISLYYDPNEGLVISKCNITAFPILKF